MTNNPAAVKKFIQKYLNQSLLAVVSWNTGNIPESGLFLFGNDTGGRIYIRVKHGSRLEAAVQRDPGLSLLIYREEHVLEEITAIRAAGKAALLTAPDAIQEGYQRLREKSPLLGQTPYLEERENYRIIRIDIDEFRTHNYREYLAGTPPFTLKKQPSAHTKT